MATYLGFPFDPELFNYNWANAKDPTLTAMFESGAVAPNAELAGLISNGSDFYTLPFYKVIGGTPENYDGATDITLTDPEGSAQNGIVFGGQFPHRHCVGYAASIVLQVAPTAGRRRTSSLITTAVPTPCSRSCLRCPSIGRSSVSPSC